MKKAVLKAVRFGLYPTLLFIVIAVIVFAITYGWEYKIVYGATTVFLVLVLMITETALPLSHEWSMTKESFKRDIHYILIDAPVIILTKTVWGFLAIYYSEHHRGLFSSTPLLLSVVVFLLVFEFLQYWYHRLSHQGKGRTGQLLWNIHLAHHLPDKVYVAMHAVFNPINAFLTTTIIQLPLILLGISPESALAATLLIDLQSLVSHFNVDIRAGFLNYIFIGTETHRYHHSANTDEAKNFGNTLAIWDILFGTFYYKPGIAPEKLGLDNPDDYPKSEDLLAVISLPFRKEIV